MKIFLNRVKDSLKEDEQKNEEIRKEKTPQEILSLLLKNTFNKALFKLEKNTKEQESTIKEIGKYFVFFEKKLISMTNGVKKKLIEDEKKRKEEERRQKLMAKIKKKMTMMMILFLLKRNKRMR